MIQEITQHYARPRASTACLMSSSKVGFLPAELGKFVLRSQVLSLYRKFFRTARTLPPQQKGEVLSEVRREFSLQRGKEAPYDIKFALSDGRNKLKMLEEAIGFSR